MKILQEENLRMKLKNLNPMHKNILSLEQMMKSHKSIGSKRNWWNK